MESEDDMMADDDGRAADADDDDYDDGDVNYDHEADVIEIKELLSIFDAIFHGISRDAIAMVFNTEDHQRLLRDLDNLRIVVGHRKRLRKARVRRVRMDIEELHKMLLETNQFSRLYRMEKEHYDYLKECILEDISLDSIQAARSTGGQEPISPDLIMKVALDQLAFGTSPFTSSISHGLSESSLNRVTDMFLDAIDDNTTCPELQIKLPDATNNLELSELAGRWSEASTVYKVFDGFLGALDGWLPRTTMPVGVKNQSDYFSGHYQCYGLNIQAMCDPDLVFMYAAAAGPGKTNDCRAFNRCEGLKHWLESLPPEYFIGADNAYPLSQKLLIPFNAAEAKHRDNRTYNFYLSQLRIRIEMAFGLLTTKWRILRNALTCHPWKNAKIVRVCMKLHNFCIRMKQKDGGGRIGKLSGRVNLQNFEIEPLEGENGIGNSLMGFLPTHTDDEDADENENHATNISTIHGSETSTSSSADTNDETAANARRSSIVRDLFIREYRRPMRNIHRSSRSNEEEDCDEEYHEEEGMEEDVEENGVDFYWQRQT